MLPVENSNRKNHFLGLDTTATFVEVCMCVCVRSESVHATRVLLRIGIVQRTFQAFLAKKNSTSSSLLVLPLSFSPASCGRSTSLCRVLLLLFSMRAGRLNRSDGTAAVWLRIMFWPAQFPPPFYTKKKRKEQHTRAGADTSFARRRDTGVRKSKTKKREKDSSTKQAGKEHTTTQLLSAPPLMIRAALVTHGVTIKTRE